MGLAALVTAAVLSGASVTAPVDLGPTSFSVSVWAPTTVLTPVDAVSGAPIGRPKLRLNEYVGDMEDSERPNVVYSPDRRIAAFGTPDCVIARVDLTRLRELSPVRVTGGCDTEPGPSYVVTVLSWLSPDRIAVTAAFDKGMHPTPSRVGVVNLRSGRARFTRVGFEIDSASRARGGAVVLGQSERGRSPARLVSVDRAGRIKATTLSAIPVRSIAVPGPRVPGLAVDLAHRRAFVLPATGPVGVVHLTSMRVHYRRPQPPGLDADLRPSTPPAGPGDAPPRAGYLRDARWIGDGRLAISGWDMNRNGGFTPAGLRIINTNDWSAQIIDRRPDGFDFSQGVLRVSTVAYNKRTRYYEGHQLVAFDPHGDLRYKLGKVRSRHVEPVPRPFNYAVNGRIYQTPRIFENNYPQHATVRNITTARTTRHGVRVTAALLSMFRWPGVRRPSR
jgi:hypothetical protein